MAIVRENNMKKKNKKERERDRMLYTTHNHIKN